MADYRTGYVVPKIQVFATDEALAGLTVLALPTESLLELRNAWERGDEFDTHIIRAVRDIFGGRDGILHVIATIPEPVAVGQMEIPRAGA